MNKAKIDITVLMPVYNAGKYIHEAIESVLVQSFINFELLIVNDGSTDDTVDIIESICDSRISLLHTGHGGISAALNKGLSQARGRYIARFDADDICLPGRLLKQFTFLEEHPDHILVGGDAEYILETGEHLFNFRCSGHNDDEIRRNLLIFCPVIHSAVMYNKRAVMNTGGYSLHAHNFEDYLLWVQLAAKGKIANIPESLIKVRLSPSSVTIDEKWRGRSFRRLKRNVIRRSGITEQEGSKLLCILRRQDTKKVKEGAYHALCGKKFLTDNYQPARARKHFTKAINQTPLRADNYALYAISFFPRSFINWLHRRSPNKL